MTRGCHNLLVQPRSSRRTRFPLSYVKDLVFVGPNCCSLASVLHVFGRNVHQVAPECTLDTLLQTFRAESTRLALVKRVSGGSAPDVLEEILEVEILDESDVPEVHALAQRKNRLSCRYADTPALRGNMRLVLWICSTVKTHCAELVAINAELEHIARLGDEERLRLCEDIARLQRDKATLEAERPHHYLRVKQHVLRAASQVCVLM
ncbi:hypothetical protein PybrP1_009679 [[Pythium] brassicae (nom. inval.)]|nr:hypothetical protein PybrP1_009679 [[Pythium] brassicae (nom. inval.)]